ncbi:uncharacterized protein LOC110686493 [Chenopodium quinoa]|uniref:uncharacterized protein LOC110686493 n=1 Tax=Chenopodium quinoa TaxID=63459 RepID=UPI000B7782A7|nr:uncharacterized protein LOC110686493 [Chenopodium quinoa]
MHPGGDKLYKDMKKIFWWPNMKREVAEFVTKCLTCQKVKIEHRRPQEKVQSLEVPKWKWDSISMDFVGALPKTKAGNDTIWVIVDRLTKSAAFIPMRSNWTMDQLGRAYVKWLDRKNDSDHLDLIEFSYNNNYHVSIGMAPFEALYGRKCRSPICWNDISETMVLGLEMIENMVKQVKLIQEKIKAAQDRQKSYVDLKKEGRGIRSRRKGFVKNFTHERCDKKVGKVAYKLDLPNELERVHNVFHVSQIRKYIPDVTHVLQPETIEMDENLTYEERPIKILDSKVRTTRNKDVSIVKVLWSNQNTKEATWEAEADMRRRYPELFA